MARLADRAIAERRFCEVVLSMLAVWPSSQAVPESLMLLLQCQLNYAEEVTQEVYSDVMALKGEGDALAHASCQTQQSYHAWNRACPAGAPFTIASNEILAAYEKLI